MTLSRIVFALILLVALVMGPYAPDVLTQDSSTSRSEIETSPAPGVSGYRLLTTRDQARGRTLERIVVEGPSINGVATVLSEVQDEKVQVGEEASRRTRREFATDANGRQKLISITEEHRMARPDGGQLIVRDFTEPDVNGRSRSRRREREETVALGNGIFRTEIEVSVASARRGTLLPTERVEQRELRDGEQVLQLDSTTYLNATGRGAWEPVERRVLQRNYSGRKVQTVESVYRSDSRGPLVPSDRIVSREWTGSGGREYRTEHIFTTDIPNEVRTPALRLYQQVEVVRTNRPSGGSVTTRTVRESRDNRMQVVERVVERSRPDSRGGIVIERETQRLDVNGRLQTVEVSRARESTT